jgi:hypothetical protein
VLKLSVEAVIFGINQFCDFPARRTLESQRADENRDATVGQMMAEDDKPIVPAGTSQMENAVKRLAVTIK